MQYLHANPLATTTELLPPLPCPSNLSWTLISLTLPCRPKCSIVKKRKNIAWRNTLNDSVKRGKPRKPRPPSNNAAHGSGQNLIRDLIIRSSFEPLPPLTSPRPSSQVLSFLLTFSRATTHRSCGRLCRRSSTTTHHGSHFTLPVNLDPYHRYTQPPRAPLTSTLRDPLPCSADLSPAFRPPRGSAGPTPAEPAFWMRLGHSAERAEEIAACFPEYWENKGFPRKADRPLLPGPTDGRCSPPLQVPEGPQYAEPKNAPSLTRSPGAGSMENDVYPLAEAIKIAVIASHKRPNARIKRFREKYTEVRNSYSKEIQFPFSA